MEDGCTCKLPLRGVSCLGATSSEDLRASMRTCNTYEERLHMPPVLRVASDAAARRLQFRQLSVVLLPIHLYCKAFTPL